MPGEDVEWTLYRLGTGVNWSREDFHQAAERIYNLERALQVRHWGRDRKVDETVLPYFDQPDLIPNPLLDRTYSLDREKFVGVLDEFYTLHGWDPNTGRPTKEGLAGLGLPDVYEPMLAGAEFTLKR